MICAPVEALKSTVNTGRYPNIPACAVSAIFLLSSISWNIASVASSYLSSLAYVPTTQLLYHTAPSLHSPTSLPCLLSSPPKAHVIACVTALMVLKTNPMDEQQNNCTSSALFISGCNFENATCACTNPTFLNVEGPCVEAACNASDVACKLAHLLPTSHFVVPLSSRYSRAGLDNDFPP